MVKIIVKHHNPDKLNQLCDAILQSNIPCKELTGPFIPPIDKIQGEYLKCFYIKFARDNKLTSNKQALKTAIEKIKGQQAITLDVDPA